MDRIINVLWSSSAQGEVTLHGRALTFISSPKDSPVLRRIYAGVAICIFVLLATRTCASVAADLFTDEELFTPIRTERPGYHGGRATNLRSEASGIRVDNLQQPGGALLPAIIADTIPPGAPLTDSLGTEGNPSPATSDTLQQQLLPGSTPDSDSLTAGSDTSQSDSSALPDTIPPGELLPDSLSTEGKPSSATIDTLKQQLLPTSVPTADTLTALSDTSQSDSSGLADTSYVVFLDSTWRMAQALHHRKDKAIASFFPDYNNSLYLDVTSPAYSRELTMDSLGRYVTFREQVNGLDVKIPVTLPLDEYIRQRIEYEKLNNWRSFTYAYNLSDRANELGNLFSSFTKIEIPVPPNPIFSIFGKNKISLHITGGVDIRAGFRHTESDVTTLSSLDKSQNTPDFNQDVQINVDGSVGDKLKIGADWNTQRTFEYENMLKLKYQGYEDEIVKSVEAGNVSLSVPSFVGSSQALFGIKTQMQFGPLNLTALVSQKKGSSKQVSVSGGSRTVGTDISILRYSTNHYFVDSIYRQVFTIYHQQYPPSPTSAMEALKISEIEVWKSTTSAQSTTKRDAKAYYYLPDRGDRNTLYSDDLLTTLDTSTGNYANFSFVRLEEGKDYKVHTEEGYFSLTTTPAENEVIAIAYSTIGGQFYGELTGIAANQTRPLILKLIRPMNLVESMPAWNLLLKNIYSLGARNITETGLDLKIMYKPPTANESEELGGVRLLQLLRLDRYKNGGGDGADNLFDYYKNFTIDPERGELIFPDLRPFDSTLAQELRKNNVFDYDSLLIGDIYNKKLQTQDLNSSRNNLYVIRASIAGATSAHISLNSYNIVEGSVQVLYNGTPLTPGVDYDVNYIIGEVNIRKEEALVPGANIQVKYEQNDLFQMAPKTLMGARGELDVGRDSRLGFTIMNLNQETLSDKVRLGEEPTNNTILGVDGSTQWNLPFLTSALNFIPGLRVRDMSSLKVSGEAAYILPDPNTKKSTIASDNGASVAYIDDFEGSRRIIPLSLSYTAWKHSSPPVYTLLDISEALSNQVKNDIKMNSKAKLSWYNNSQSYEPASVHEIWPNKSVRVGEDLVPLLIMDYNPLRRGMYNYSMNIESTLTTNPDRNWNGILRYISSLAGDLTQQNLDYLEFWIKTTSDDSLDLMKGRMFVDIGTISEDVIPNGKLNSEDVVSTSMNPYGIQNGIYNPGEDLGLDTILNAQERAVYADLIAKYPDLAGDPSGDDYDYSTGSYNFDRINGVEGNNERNAMDSRFPDTEDLNNNSNVDVSNEYIEYEVPLSNALPTGEQNRFIVGGGNNKWYQIRIPLRDTSRVVGSQTAASILQNVQYFRMWFSGYSKPVRVRIAEINFVGNQWTAASKDSVLKLSVVNFEDNPGYTIPPGVVRERDKTQSDQQIYGNEQSLALVLTSLNPGESREAAKYFAQRAIDMFSYKALKMFVHGDNSFGDAAEIYIRFGADTNNYYEYSQPLLADWDEMTLTFTELTSIKAARDSGATFSRIAAPSGPAGSYYSIKGNPALTKVQYIGVGVRNISEPFPIKLRYTTPPRSLSGQVWVNELRVIGADNSRGGAYRFDTQLKFAEFGGASFNYSYSDPNYHGVDVAFGDRITKKAWAVNTNFALDKLLPQEMQTAGAALPIAYSHQENVQLPKYLPSTDVVVEEAARRAAERLSSQSPEVQKAASDQVISQSQTVGVRENFSISNFKLGLPWKVWYIKDIFNSFSWRFNFASSNDRNPTIVSQKTWQWTFGMNYGVNFNNTLFLQPFSSLFADLPFLDTYKDWKLYFFPLMGFNSSLDGGRSFNYSLSRSTNAVPHETRAFSGSKQLSFDWKITEGGVLGIGGNYGISLRRDLLYLDTTGNRGFSQILHALFFGGRDGQYSQAFKLNMKPRIPNILDIERYLDQISTQYSVNYGWQNALRGGDIGKSAAWDNSISVGTNFRLKALADLWFGDKAGAPAPSRNQPPPRPKRQEPRNVADSTQAENPEPEEEPEDTTSSSNPLTKIKDVARILIKYPLLDYESINISFSQANHSGNSGVIGGTGIKNFWGVLPFQNPNMDTMGGGPTRLYQLGLVSDPSSTLRFSNRFPFFERWSYRGPEGWVKNSKGLRAKNGILTDEFSQKNDINLKTSRPLWEGATLDINWKVGWQYRKTTTIKTDSVFGIPYISSSRTSGSVERSFLSIPPVFLFKVFKSGLEDVGKKYDENIKKEQYATSPGAAAANAFERGLEAFPFLNKFFGQFVPRANWNLRWSGVEKLVGATSWIQSMSLDHSYNSSLRRDFYINDKGVEETSMERVSYNFAPLIGINTTFKELWKGNFTGSFQYKTSTGYDLSLSNQKITEDVTTEMAFTLNYGRKGFEFPLFGLTLKNDLDFSFTYSRAKKATRQHDPLFLIENQEGTPMNGNIQTRYEPRIRYTISARVNMSLYYRYTRNEPDQGGSTVPGTTTSEAGLELHISIN